MKASRLEAANTNTNCSCSSCSCHSLIWAAHLTPHVSSPLHGAAGLFHPQPWAAPLPSTGPEALTSGPFRSSRSRSTHSRPPSSASPPSTGPLRPHPAPHTTARSVSPPWPPGRLLVSHQRFGSDLLICFPSTTVHGHAPRGHLTPSLTSLQCLVRCYLGDHSLPHLVSPSFSST